MSSDADWVGRELSRSGHAIARVVLAAPLTPSDTCIVRVGVRSGDDSRQVYAHRRVFADSFPIGTWGAAADQYVTQRQHHIDTCVAGGSASEPFFARDARRFGYRALLYR